MYMQYDTKHDTQNLVSTVSTKSLYYRTTHMTRSVRMRLTTLVSPEQHVSTSTVTGSTNPY